MAIDKKEASERGGRHLDIHILIVEDDEAISNLIKLNLTMVGYKSTQIFNGLEVLPFLEKNSVDLILLDIMLPGMDGFHLMEHIQNIRRKLSLSDAIKTVYKIGYRLEE